MKREKLAGHEAPRGIGSEAFRAGRAGCEQDQNHHCQPRNHTEPPPVTFSDSDLLLVSGRSLALALSHDGLWVFANRILANWIFAHRVLADWRRRHRGRLLARQIGGSGNAQHGHEPSRYDYDSLHDANTLVVHSARAARVTPLFRFVCAKRPLLPSHVPAQSPGEWLPTICRFGDGLVQMRLGGSGRTQINQMVSRQHRRQPWRSPASLPPFFYRSAPAGAYLSTADASNLLLVFQ